MSTSSSPRSSRRSCNASCTMPSGFHASEPSCVLAGRHAEQDDGGHARARPAPSPRPAATPACAAPRRAARRSAAARRCPRARTAGPPGRRRGGGSRPRGGAAPGVRRSRRGRWYGKLTADQRTPAPTRDPTIGPVHCGPVTAGLTAARCGSSSRTRDPTRCGPNGWRPHTGQRSCDWAAMAMKHADQRHHEPHRHAGAPVVVHVGEHQADEADDERREPGQPERREAPAQLPVRLDVRPAPRCPTRPNARPRPGRASPESAESANDTSASERRPVVGAVEVVTVVTSGPGTATV